MWKGSPVESGKRRQIALCLVLLCLLPQPLFLPERADGATRTVPLAEKPAPSVPKPQPPEKPENAPPVKPGKRPPERPGGERPPHPPAHPHPGWNRPHVWWPYWDAHVENQPRRSSEDFPAPTPPGPDGAIFVVPASQAKWEKDVDLASNTFEMRSLVSLYSDMPLSEIAEVRAVFTKAVERESVETELSEDGKRITIKGRVAAGYAIRAVELIQIVMEFRDGRTYVQNLSIGFDA